MTADLALINARIHTSDPDQPTASVLVVQDGIVTAVGDDRTVVPAGVPVHDLGGRTVTPGFIDSHTHPSMVSQSQWHVRLPWTTDVDELLAFVRDYAAEHPKEEAPFLYFEYYPSVMFRDSPPTRHMLDEVVSDRPVLCQDFNDHEHWVNSKMLELMGVDASTPDPVPGLEMFVRDENGEPTGQLLEFVHYHFLDTMYDALGWRPPEELTPERIAPFFRFMAECGVTSLFEALIDDEQIVESVAELDRRGELRLNFEGAVRFRDSRDLPEAIAKVKRLDAEFGGPHVRVRALKLFLDGTNEIGNSAVLAPMLSDDTEDALGAIGMETAELMECLLLCNAEQVDVHIHMVGDRAFRTACDAVEAAQKHLAANDEPWNLQVTFAHCELVDPADMARPAQLGILINWTMHWSGGYFGEEARQHLGDDRFERMYRFTEMIESGASVAFSSDVVTAYELPRANPFFGMQVAATRVDPQFPLDPESFPGSVRPSADSRLTRETLLAGLTRAGARQLRLDHRTGSLMVGKSADFVVLSDDLFEIPVERIGEISPLAVFFEGELVAGDADSIVS